MGATPEQLAKWRNDQAELERRVRAHFDDAHPKLEAPEGPEWCIPIRKWEEGDPLPTSAKTLLKRLAEYEWDYRVFYNQTRSRPTLFATGDRAGEVRYAAKVSDWTTVIARRKGHPIVRVIFQTVGGKTQASRRVSSELKELSDKELKVYIEHE